MDNFMTSILLLYLVKILNESYLILQCSVIQKSRGTFAPRLGLSLFLSSFNFVYTLFRVQLVNGILIPVPRGIAVNFSFSSSNLFYMTFFNVCNLVLLLLLAIGTSRHYHLTHWHIFLSGTLLIVLPSICVSIVRGAPIILLKILFIVLEACKTITKK